MSQRIYPKTKFAKTNSLSEQLRHIKSEYIEAFEALNELLENAISNNEKYDSGLIRNLTMEVHDICHSGQTMLDIIEREFGDGYINPCREFVRMKNRDRGYYEEG